MSAPSKAYTVQSVKIRSEVRVASASELNSAPGGVTCHREARGMECRAATNDPSDGWVPRGLSPEITIVSEADVVHLCGKRNSHNRNRRGYVSPTGSETVARYQKDSMGTREARSAPERVCGGKLINGKLSQMELWESDQLIVVMKQGNACGGKGLAGKPRWTGDTSSAHRGGYKKRTKPNHETHPAQDEEVFLKSRMWENHKSGSVRGLMVDSNNRRWP